METGRVLIGLKWSFVVVGLMGLLRVGFWRKSEWGDEVEVAATIFAKRVVCWFM